VEDQPCEAKETRVVSGQEGKDGAGVALELAQSSTKVILREIYIQ
jgi:hypothetical protein